MAKLWHVYKIEVDGVLIYIGTSCNVAKRRQDHLAKHYIPLVGGEISVIDSFGDREQALAAERKAIRELRPVGNFQSNPSYKTVKERNVAVYLRLNELEAERWRRLYADIEN